MLSPLYGPRRVRLPGQDPCRPRAERALALLDLATDRARLEDGEGEAGGLAVDIADLLAHTHHLASRYALPAPRELAHLLPLALPPALAPVAAPPREREMTNEDRADLAYLACRALSPALTGVGEPRQLREQLVPVLARMIAELEFLAALNRLDFSRLLEQAEGYYRADTGPEGDPPVRVLAG